MIGNTLPEIERLAGAYLRQFNQAFDARWTKDYAPAAIKAAGDEAAASVREQRDLLNNEINSLCDSYLAAPELDRTALRAEVGNFPNLLKVLRQYVGWCSTHINSVADSAYLRRALAAVSLEDNRSNYRETYLALGSLYIKCVSVGLQPSMEFVKVACLSNAAKGRAGFSTHDLLANFETSAFFKADVEPKL